MNRIEAAARHPELHAALPDLRPHKRNYERFRTLLYDLLCASQVVKS